MNKYTITHEYRSNTYMKISDLAETYHTSSQNAYLILKEIEASPRYKGHWITINDFGVRMVNSLVFEDFLHYRTELKNPNLARHLPPYDPAKVRAERGECRIVTTGLCEDLGSHRQGDRSDEKREDAITA